MIKIVLASLFLILAIHSIALSNYWYNSIWWLDIPMHLIGGAWVSLLFFSLFFKKLACFQDKWRNLSLIILSVSFVALIGVLWEFYEYLFDVFVLKTHPLAFVTDPGNLPDTIADLFNDLIGGAATAMLIQKFFHSKLI
jgi:hypothetical protein